MYLGDDQTDIYVTDTKHRRRLHIPARFESMHQDNQVSQARASTYINQRSKRSLASASFWPGLLHTTRVL